jgi:hypothetical protein
MQMKIYPIFTLAGWVLILVSFVIGLTVLAPTAASYFGENAKAARDAATVGSGLLGQLETLKSTPAWLEPLTFLGVAAFMTGIALEFSTIPSILKNRGEVMSLCFPLLVQKGE